MTAACLWKREPVSIGKVYRNLNNGLLSIMGMDGLVHGHFAQVSLMNVTFKVSAVILAQIRRQKRKTVGMWAKGDILFVADRISVPEHAKDWERVRFNPYLHDGFTTHSGIIITSAERLFITSTGDMFALHPKA